MSILLKTLEIYDNLGTLVSTITDDVALNVRISKGRKGGEMDFTLKNAIKTYDGTDLFGTHVSGFDFIYDVQKEWTVKLYLKYSDTNETIDTSVTTDLIMTSDVVETEAKITDKVSTWKLKCVDKSYLMLSKLWSFNYDTADGKTAPEMIQEVIRITTGDGKGTSSSEVTASLIDSFTAPIAGIQNLRPDGSAFPTQTLAKVHKPVYEWIETLSQTDYINTAVELDSDTIPAPRPFVFYIDELNRAIWVSPETNSPEHIINIGSTSAISPDTHRHIVYNMSLKRGQLDIVNFIIFNAGDDWFGSGILDYNYDRNTQASKLQATYKPWIKITQNMKEEEILGGNSAQFTKNTSSGTLTFNDNRYDASYPLTPHWTTSAVANDVAYNSSLRSEAILRGDVAAQRTFDGKGSPLWKGKMELKGYKYHVGELIQLTSSIHGIKDILIRITDVQHNIGKTGWFTTLSVQEDNPAIRG